MRETFDPNFVGLQIDWEEDDEIEYLGPSVLSGAASYTAGTCRRSNRTISYLYPVKAKSSSQSQLILKYDRNPATWSESWGWQICRGELLIDFHELGRYVPRRVAFLYNESGEEVVLKEGTDWVYVEPTSGAQTHTEPKPRIKALRIARPRQQHLRNLLLSEYGKCQVTGAQCPETLEACHIVPVANGGVDTVANALLLRRDIHALFDAALLRFVDTGSNWVVELDSRLTDPSYSHFQRSALADISSLSVQFLRLRETLETKG